MRALEPTCTEDRGLAWSGMAGRSWERAPVTTNSAMNRNEDEIAVNREDMYVVRYGTLLVCFERAGPTPSHPEPGRETAQRRGYWGDDSLGEQVNAPLQQVVVRCESDGRRHPSRRGAVAARRAHNPKVGSSNLSAATKSTRPADITSAGLVFNVTVNRSQWSVPAAGLMADDLRPRFGLPI